MKMNEAIYYAGNAEKILFGTDYPVSKHSDMLKLIDRLDLNEKDKEKILGRNAERVFHF
jgi:predicted TIM-barrel fold metal-dependent hydrolase